MRVIIGEADEPSHAARLDYSASGHMGKLLRELRAAQRSVFRTAGDVVRAAVGDRARQRLALDLLSYVPRATDAECVDVRAVEPSRRLRAGECFVHDGRRYRNAPRVRATSMCPTRTSWLPVNDEPLAASLVPGCWYDVLGHCRLIEDAASRIVDATPLDNGLHRVRVRRDGELVDDAFDAAAVDLAHVASVERGYQWERVADPDDADPRAVRARRLYQPDAFEDAMDDPIGSVLVLDEPLLLDEPDALLRLERLPKGTEPGRVAYFRGVRRPIVHPPPADGAPVRYARPFSSRMLLAHGSLVFRNATATPKAYACKYAALSAAADADADATVLRPSHALHRAYPLGDDDASFAAPRLSDAVHASLRELADGDGVLRVARDEFYAPQLAWLRFDADAADRDEEDAAAREPLGPDAHVDGPDSVSVNLPAGTPLFRRPLPWSDLSSALAYRGPLIRRLHRAFDDGPRRCVPRRHTAADVAVEPSPGGERLAYETLVATRLHHAPPRSARENADTAEVASRGTVRLNAAAHDEGVVVGGRALLDAARLLHPDAGVCGYLRPRVYPVRYAWFSDEPDEAFGAASDEPTAFVDESLARRASMRDASAPDERRARFAALHEPDALATLRQALRVYGDGGAEVRAATAPLEVTRTLAAGTAVRALPPGATRAGAEIACRVRATPSAFVVVDGQRRATVECHCHASTADLLRADAMPTAVWVRALVQRRALLAQGGGDEDDVACYVVSWSDRAARVFRLDPGRNRRLLQAFERLLDQACAHVLRGAAFAEGAWLACGAPAFDTFELAAYRAPPASPPPESAGRVLRPTVLFRVEAVEADTAVVVARHEQRLLFVAPASVASPPVAPLQRKSDGWYELGDARDVVECRRADGALLRLDNRTLGRFVADEQAAFFAGRHADATVREAAALLTRVVDRCARVATHDGSPAVTVDLARRQAQSAAWRTALAFVLCLARRRHPRVSFRTSSRPIGVALRNLSRLDHAELARRFRAAAA